MGELALVITALGIAVPSIVAAILSVATFITSQRTKADVAMMKVDVKDVKHATNSLTDALVRAKGESEFARGAKQEREKQELIAGGIAAAQVNSLKEAAALSTTPPTQTEIDDQQRAAP